MSTVDVRTAGAGDRFEDPERIASTLAPLVPGLAPRPGDAVTSVLAPGIRARADENSWKSLLGDPTEARKRRGLLAQIQSLLELDGEAKKKGMPLADAARERAELYRRTMENAWVALLQQNRVKEQAVRWAALFFSNMQDGVQAFRNRIFAINATAEEIASDAGRQKLAAELSHYVDRPDPRNSRAYLVVHGWTGSAHALHRLARVAHDHRAILVSDAPPFDDVEKLRAASEPGGLLEALPGEEVFHRHAILVANQGRARTGFRGAFAKEKGHVFVPLSGPWFGMYLDRIARGEPWRPAVGYQNPIAGIDGVLVDLTLRTHDGHSLYERHRLNPALLLSPNSEKVVIWGPDALSKAGRGVQMGVAVVEMIVVRYAEWIVNQYGLLDDLDKAEDVVKAKLAEFVNANSGAGRMFRSGSRVQVTADHQTRTLNVEFDLLFREVAERAVIRVKKPVARDPGEVNATSMKS